MTRWVETMLGANKVSVELEQDDVETAMETSLMKYSSILNMYLIKNNFQNIIGSATASDLTYINLKQNMNLMHQLSAAYEDEVEAGGNEPVHVGYVSWSANEKYVELISNTGNSRLLYDDGSAVTADSIALLEVYYTRPKYSSYFYNPFDFIKSEFGSQGVAYSQSQQYFQIYPLWGDMLNASYLKTQAQFRRSIYQYMYAGKRLWIFPVPNGTNTGNNPLKVWIKFKLRNIESVFDTTDVSTSGVNSPATAPYQNLDWDKINDMSQSWVREYTLALCKQILGRVRSKYGTIPIPENEITLDGPILLDEGKADAEKLETKLEEDLDKLLYREIMKSEAEKAEALNTIYKFVPSPIIRGF